MKTCAPTTFFKWRIAQDGVTKPPTIIADKATASPAGKIANPIGAVLVQAWLCDDGSVEWHEVEFEK